MWNLPKTWREKLMTGKGSKDFAAGKKRYLMPHAGLTTLLPTLDSH